MDFSYILTDYVTLISLILMAVAFIMLAIYYGLFFFRVGHYGKRKKTKKIDANAQNSSVNDEKLPPVSIVLVAHNEGYWLRDNLVYLLEQDYPNFEVVVVDYKSTDDTRFILQVCSENYHHLNCVRMDQDVNMFRGKKYPLSIGIRSAKNDVIMLTDSDCKPIGFDWLRQMVKGYNKSNTQIVLGYCGINQSKGLLNLLQQYDNLHYSAHYLGNALLKHPTTATGRNLSYRRSYFFERGAFIRHYSQPYGADDLFVNQNAKSSNTNISIAEDAFVMMDAKRNFAEWHLMRKLRIITDSLHPFGERLSACIYPINIVVFYVSWLFLLLTNRFPWEILVGIMALKFTWQIITENQLSKRFKVKFVQWLSPIFEIYFLIANTILRILPLPKNRM